MAILSFCIFPVLCSWLVICRKRTAHADFDLHTLRWNNLIHPLVSYNLTTVLIAPACCTRLLNIFNCPNTQSSIRVRCVCLIAESQHGQSPGLHRCLAPHHQGWQSSQKTNVWSPQVQKFDSRTNSHKPLRHSMAPGRYLRKSSLGARLRSRLNVLPRRYASAKKLRDCDGRKNCCNTPVLFTKPNQFQRNNKTIHCRRLILPACEKVLWHQSVLILQNQKQRNLKLILVQKMRVLGIVQLRRGRMTPVKKTVWWWKSLRMRHWQQLTRQACRQVSPCRCSWVPRPSLRSVQPCTWDAQVVDWYPMQFRILWMRPTTPSDFPLFVKIIAPLVFSSSPMTSCIAKAIQSLITNSFRGLAKPDNKVQPLEIELQECSQPLYRAA